MTPDQVRSLSLDEHAAFRDYMQRWMKAREEASRGA
jgi:hypothetical protein